MSRYAPRALGAALAALLALPAFAQDAATVAGDPAAGEKVFKKCAACHSLDPSGKSKVGPDLYGVIDRPTASVADFKYSDAMAKLGAEGHVWSVEEIEKYLENPKAMVPGTKMTFVGLKKPEDRADVVAYIASVSSGAAPAN